MYNIDPPSRILRLDAPRKGDGGTVFKSEPAAPIQLPAQLDRYLAKRSLAADALSDAIAVGCTISDVSHKGDHVIAKLSFDADAAILRLKAINEAHDDLARDIAAL